MRDNNTRRQRFISAIVKLVPSTAVGYALAMRAFTQADELHISLFGSFSPTVVLLIEFALAFYLHIIIYEAGHFVFGKLTGYGFVSFRVGSIMLIKSKNALSLKRYSMPGTGAQCIMSPPEYNGGGFPFVLYNLGGIIANTIAAAVFLAIKLVCVPSAVLDLFCVTMASVGSVMAIMNGIPISVGNTSNDGYNTMSIRRDPLAGRCFWTMLHMSGLHGYGVRLRQIDPALLELPPDADLSNMLISQMLYLREARCMDALELEGARAAIEKALSPKCRLVGFFEAYMKLDALFIELVERGEAADTSVLNEEAVARTMRSRRKFPPVIRTLYALHAARGDDEAAKKQLELLAKIEKTYPYPQSIDAERELIELFDGAEAVRKAKGSGSEQNEKLL